VNDLGKKENIIALKSLFSMVVALISIIGIAVTLFSYFVISPALTEMNSSFIHMASTLVNINDGLILFESDLNRVRNNQVELSQNTINTMKEARSGIKAARESIQEIERVESYGLSSQLIELKRAEDDLTSYISDAEVTYGVVKEFEETDLFRPELSSELLRNLNVLDISIKSFGTMFTALTIISLILFGVMILISIENLL
jgi:hypothetical protein